MKANQFAKDNQAQVGIGTMIVFIATVLVAAVAAGVLINVSGDLQGQSKSTASDAREEVSNSLRIVRAYARDVTTDTVTDDVEARDSGVDDDEADELHLLVALSAGAKATDLSRMQVVVETQAGVATYSYFNHGPRDTAQGAIVSDGNTPAQEGYYFALEEQGAADRSANTEIDGATVFNVRILGHWFDPTGAGAPSFGDRLNIGTGEKVRVTLVPESGASLFLELNMPKVMDTDYEQLY